MARLPVSTGRTVRRGHGMGPKRVDSRTYGPDEITRPPGLLTVRRFPRVRPDYQFAKEPGHERRRFPARTGRISSARRWRASASVDSRAYGPEFSASLASASSVRRFPRARDDSRLSKGQPFRPSIPAAQGGELGDDLERGVTPSIPARTGWRCAVGQACERPSRARMRASLVLPSSSARVGRRFPCARDGPSWPGNVSPLCSLLT